MLTVPDYIFQNVLKNVFYLMLHSRQDFHKLKEWYTFFIQYLSNIERLYGQINLPDKLFVGK